jgi:hypothetical protein
MAGMLGSVVSVGFNVLEVGSGCWFVKFSTMSAPGLDVPSQVATLTAGVGFVLPHKPPAVEAVLLGLRLLCV